MYLPGEALYFALNHPMVQSHSRHQRYNCSKSLSYIYQKNTCLCIEAITVILTKLFRTAWLYLRITEHKCLPFLFLFLLFACGGHRFIWLVLRLLILGLGGSRGEHLVKPAIPHISHPLPWDAVIAVQL